MYKPSTINAAARHQMDAAKDEVKMSEKDALELITIKEACEKAKSSRWTISRWLKQKNADGNYIIRWFKLGSAQTSPVRIDKASFEAFFESKVQQAGEGKEEGK